MGHKKPTARVEFVLFNVPRGWLSHLEPQSSRRIAVRLGRGCPARDFIEAQDREILARSGLARAPIKSISRAF